MRQRIFDKLRDRGGVTILMALFAMLVASMVCIVILGAAVTTVKQAKADQAQEQNTLTLQSAGELILSEIQKTGEIRFITTETVSNSDTPSYGDPSFEHGDNSSSLTSELGSAADAMLNKEERSVSFKVSASAQDPAYAQTVHASMSFKRGTDANGESDSSCQLTIALDLHDPSDSTDASTIVQSLYLRVGYTIGTTLPVTEDNKATYTTILEYGGNTRFYLAEDVSQDA